MILIDVNILKGLHPYKLPYYISRYSIANVIKLILDSMYPIEEKKIKLFIVKNYRVFK